MANKTSVHKKQQPHWLWRHKRREEKLQKILKSLQRSTTDQITAEKAQHCGIQLTPLDFYTGDTSPLVRSSFTPRDDDDLLIKRPTWMLRKSNFFRCSLGTGLQYKSKTPNQREGLLRSALAQAFKNYRVLANISPNSRAYRVPDLHSFNIDGFLDGKIHHNNGKPAKFTVVDAHRLWSKDSRMRQNHQMITISTNEHPGSCPSITELQVLVTMLRQAMIIEARTGQFNCCYRRNSQHRMTKYLFPILVTTIYRGGYVRVVYGYMDGTLNVQYTESQHVTVENFEAMMQKLLQWSMAETQGDPTQVVTLPPILEEEEPTEQLTDYERTIHDSTSTDPPAHNHHPKLHSCTLAPQSQTRKGSKKHETPKSPKIIKAYNLQVAIGETMLTLIPMGIMAPMEWARGRQA